MPQSWRIPTALFACALMLPLLAVPVGAAQPGPAQRAILEHYRQQAGGVEFSAERGRKLFSSHHTGGKPKTPSCTTCHTADPRNAGRTRAGKRIAPMALSVTPSRFSDPKKVRKWFRRNCRSVLGRECTPQEKGDFLTFMFSQ